MANPDGSQIGGEISDPSDAGPTEGEACQRKWLSVIEQYDRAFQKWHKRCDKITKIYSEERRDQSDEGRKMSLLWSNISTLQPAVYSRQPNATVSRRFRDDDPVAREASELLERCLEFTADFADIDSVMRFVRDDFLLTARGAAWVNYAADFDALLDDDGNELNKAGEPLDPDNDEDEPGEELTEERVEFEFVHWRDFGHNLARNWQEVTCVWKRAFMSRDEGLDRFGKKFSDVGLDHKVGDDDGRDDSDEGKTNAKATVYEIWDKVSKKVYWIAKNAKEPLEISDPPLKLSGFFPAPKPAYGTITTGSLIPRPDYVFYQDQVEEIDALTQRIGALVKSLKVAGVYPSGASDVSNAIQQLAVSGMENKLIGIPNWAALKDGGGMKGLIEWWPVDQVAEVLKGCFETRKQLIEDVYQITGISDIMRGEGDAQETASAQNIKAQWGSIRIRDRQTVLANFARDLFRIAADIIATKFQPETLLEMSNLQLPSRAQLEAQQLEQQRQALMQAQQQAMQAQQAPSPQQPPQQPQMGAPQ